MTGTIGMTLALGPLAIYFLVLGSWLGGRRARVVSGPLDFALLAAGLGGLLIFGPVGHAVVHAVFPAPSVWAWLALPSAWCLFVLIWAPRTARRVVVYNVRPEPLALALAESIEALPLRFEPTLRGFEDVRGGRGVSVELGRGSRIAVVEAYGRAPDALMAALGPELRLRLREVPALPSPLARIWTGLAAGLLLAAGLVLLWSRPQLREALRAWLGR